MKNSLLAWLESIFFLAPGVPNWVVVLVIFHFLACLAIFFLTKPEDRKKNPKKIVRILWILWFIAVVISIPVAIYTTSIFVESLQNSTGTFNSDQQQG